MRRIASLALAALMTVAASQALAKAKGCGSDTSTKKYRSVGVKISIPATPAFTFDENEPVVKLKAKAEAVCKPKSATDDRPAKKISIGNLKWDGTTFTFTPNPTAAEDQLVEADALVFLNNQVGPNRTEAFATGSFEVDRALVGTAPDQKIDFKFTHRRVSEAVNCVAGCAAPIGGGFAYSRIVDPVVYGTGSFTSSLGGTFDALPLFTAGDRFLDMTYTMGEPSGPTSNGVLPPAGAEVAVLTRALVRAGDDDDPDDEGGEIWFEVRVSETSEGLDIGFFPGEDTADFAFSFDKTEAEIVSDIAAFLAGSATDADLFTGTVTLLQDEATMPRMTVLVIHGNPEVTVPALRWPGAAALTLLLLLVAARWLSGSHQAKADSPLL